MSSTHEHLEHAEHASHAANVPFDRRVAVTMAIVAAILAGVAMVGHRLHNQTLIHQSEAGNLKVQESNAWAQYQAKRLRQNNNTTTIDLLSLLSVNAETKEKREAKIADLAKKNKEYDNELKDIKKQAEKLAKDAKEAEELAHYLHKQANFCDLAHLSVEIGLVICSIALLTKKKGYWLLGIVSSLVGLALLAYALNLPKGHHNDDDHKHSKDEPKAMQTSSH